MADLQSPPRKRARQVLYEDVASITEESEGYGATVHGAIASVSPMKGKSATKYFDGYVTDGVKKLRFIGFDADKAKQLEQHANNQEPIILSNCCIKHTRYGNQLEIIVGDRTDISKSALTFEVNSISDVAEPESKAINLGELQNQPPYQKIVTSAKILEIDEVVTLEDGRKVQNALMSDATGRAKISLWQDSIGQVDLNKSYKFSNLIVKTFNEENTLFTPKTGLIIDSIEDIEDALPLLDSIKKTKHLENAQVVAVTNFSSGYVCLNCTTSKLVSMEEDPKLGKCPNCLSIVLTSSCTFQVTALLHVLADGFRFQLLSSGANLSAIAGKELKEITQLALLQAPSFNATYSSINMTITNVTHM